MRRSKYGNRKTVVDGIVFDSQKEAQRYRELLLLERAGKISYLDRQTKFTLIPAQREPSTEMYKRGRNKGKEKPGKLLEDTKGVRTEAYKIKRKLMLERYGIQIREV